MFGLLPTAFDFQVGYDRDALIYLAKNKNDIFGIEHSEVFITLAENKGKSRDEILYKRLKSIDRMHTHYARYGKKVGTGKNPFTYSEEKYDSLDKHTYGIMHENKVHEQRNKFQESQNDFELLVLDDQHMYWLNKARNEWGLELNDLLKLANQQANGNFKLPKGKKVSDLTKEEKQERKIAAEALSMLQYLAETHKEFAEYLQDYLTRQIIV